MAAQPDKHFFSADGADEAKFFGTELATIEPRVFSPEVDFKIEAGGGALIHQFAARGNMIAIRALLDRRDKGISPHCAHSHFDDVNLADGFGRTALHFAAANGHLETARGLILCKADVFLRTHDGKMPLHLAAENEHSDLVAFLGSQLRQTSICAGSSSLEEMKRAMALHRHRLDHTRHNLAKAAGLGLGSKSPPCKQDMTAEDGALANDGHARVYASGAATDSAASSDAVWRSAWQRGSRRDHVSPGNAACRDCPMTMAKSRDGNEDYMSLQLTVNR